MNNQQIPWELAKELGRNQTARPLSETEKKLMKQGNIEAITAAIIPAVIESRPELTAEQCVKFAFRVGELVVEKASSARDAIQKAN